MATLRDIKNRITGVKNTQQITKAMKMVAAARLKKAQDNMISARPYARKITEVLSHLLKLEKDLKHPLLEEREVKKVSVVVVTSDRGLCGAFNMNVIREAEEVVKKEYSDFYNSGNIDMYLVGKKGCDYFSKRNFNVAELHPGIFAHLKFDFAAKLINELSQKFIEGKTDKVVIVYNQFVSVISQKVTVSQLLPIIPQVSTSEPKAEEQNFAEYIYEPDKLSIIKTLLPRQLKAGFWKVLLESYAAELGARMTAMDMATENAKELIRTLNITYNKERQAAITTEILEIVSGANALKGN